MAAHCRRAAPPFASAVPLPGGSASAMRGCIRVLLSLRHFALAALLRWPLSCGFAVALLFRLSSWFAAVGLPVWAVLPACVVARVLAAAVSCSWGVMVGSLWLGGWVSPLSDWRLRWASGLGWPGCRCAL